MQTLLAQNGEKSEILKITTARSKLQKSKLSTEKIESEYLQHTTGKGLFIKEIQESLLKKEKPI